METQFDSGYHFRKRNTPPNYGSIPLSPKKRPTKTAKKVKKAAPKATAKKAPSRTKAAKGKKPSTKAASKPKKVAKKPKAVKGVSSTPKKAAAKKSPKKAATKASPKKTAKKAAVKKTAAKKSAPKKAAKAPKKAAKTVSKQAVAKKPAAKASKKAVKKAKAAKPKKAPTKTVKNLGNGIATEAPPKAKPKIKINVEKFRGILLGLRSRLRGDVNMMSQEALHGNTSNHAPLHPAEIGTHSFEQEFTLKLASSDTDRLHRIEAALEKLKEGTYGACEECGSRIPQARLEYVPDTPYCVNCAEKLDG